MTRIVFMGSPGFAVPALRALASHYEVVGVVTQPDRESGRGRSLKSPPVKTLALELGLDVIQPEKLRAPEAMDQLHLWNPELIVVAAFGQILKPDVLTLPPTDALIFMLHYCRAGAARRRFKPRFWLAILKPA